MDLQRSMIYNVLKAFIGLLTVLAHTLSECLTDNLKGHVVVANFSHQAGLRVFASLELVSGGHGLDDR